MTATAGNDSLVGTTAADTLDGLEGNDTLLGLQGNDDLSGGAGNDSIEGGDGEDALRGNDGNDLIRGGAGNDGGPQGLTSFITGGAGSDTLFGDDGDDQIFGFNNNSGISGADDLADSLDGGNGNDILRGNAGHDTLRGGAGNDNLRGDTGDDLLDGGDGVDFLSYRFDELTGLSAGIRFDVSAVTTGSTSSQTLSDGIGGIDTLISIERFGISGSALSDTITGNSGDDQVSGGNGDDVLRGKEGNDTIRGGAGSDTLFGDEGDDQIFGFDNNSGISGADELADSLDGGNGHDMLRGNAGSDTLRGGAGNDNLRGDAGDDVLDGGDGDDLASYRFDEITGLTAGVSFDASAITVGSGSPQTLNDGLGGTDTLTSIEWLNFNGSVFGDTLTGGAGNDQIFGNDGDDSLSGMAGADLLNGGDGDDTLVGGAGGDDLDGGNGQNVLDGGPQVLIGSYANFSLWGRLRVTVDESPGRDLVKYGTSPVAVQVDLGIDGAGTATRGTEVDTLRNIEFVSGSTFNDLIRGSNRDLNEIFRGGQGDDTIHGGSTTGIDLGFDSVDYQWATGPVQVNLAAGTASGADGNDVLTDIESVFASVHADLLIGDGSSNFLDGNWGDDTIDGGAGLDQVAYSNARTGVYIDLAAGIARSADDADVLISMEAARGSVYNDTLVGSDGPEGLQGRAGDDDIFGGGGSDLLMGGVGNDTVTGGAGNDVFFFSARGQGIDLITDFGFEDRIEIASGLAAGTPTTGTGDTVTAGRVEVSVSGATTTLWIDTDGLPGEELQIRVSGILPAGQWIVEPAAANPSAPGVGYSQLRLVGSPQITPATPSGVFIPSNGYVRLDSTPLQVFGNQGQETVVLRAAAAGVVLDQNVDRVHVVEAAGAYRFQQTGNQINLFSNGALVVRVPVQGDADGTVIVFSDGSASAVLQAGGVMRLGGVTVPATAAASLNPVLSAVLSEPTGNSAAQVFLGRDAQFTAAVGGIRIFGSGGREVLEMRAGVAAVVADQGVEAVVFHDALRNFRFQQTGNLVNVFDSTGQTQLLNMPVQGDTDGTQLTFGGQTYSVKLTAGVMRLEDVALSSSRPEAVSMATQVAVSSDGTTNAAIADFVFQFASGTYRYNVLGFGAGDVLDFPEGSESSVSNSSYTDGQVTLTWASFGQVITVTLVGLSTALDTQLNLLGDFNSVFGAGSVLSG